MVVILILGLFTISALFMTLQTFLIHFSIFCIYIYNIILINSYLQELLAKNVQQYWVSDNMVVVDDAVTHM